ncbi:hypothetical protein B4119_0661 [Parageobacillus caldoxylosilyticus]|uniref:Uncharacterized protein n=1 Tax=Saccharococcus caldoxylosilyticus TaxID=81408 RepID=A0A150L4F4_9BACL|nr:hypothetical protein B4119_0661 [Parageobacillus caldoxylosilyticus]
MEESLGKEGFGVLWKFSKRKNYKKRIRFFSSIRYFGSM